MITTLFGTNHFVLHQQLQQLIDNFTAQYTDMGVERFEGESIDAKQLPSILQAVPFLAAKRLVILKQPSAQKAIAEQLEKLLPDVAESTDVIIIEPTLDKRTSYYKTLKKLTDFHECNELDENGLARWAVDYAKGHGGTLSQRDALYLVRRVGINQTLIANELDKLCLYNPNISQTTIDEMTERTPQSSVFDLLDAAMAGNQKQVVRLYQEQRQQNVEPQAIMGMIAWQLHILAAVKTAGNKPDDMIAKEAKLNPYVVRKTQQAARSLTLGQVKQYVSDALELDVRMKSQPIDADEALLLYLMNLSAA